MGRGVEHEPSGATRSNDRLRYLTVMLDAVPVAIIVTDVEGRLEYWNRFAEHLYGWKADEILGRLIVDILLPEPIRAEGQAAIASTMAGNDTTGEFTLQRRDGTSFPAEARAMPIRDETGRITGLVGVSYDISDKKRAESERFTAIHALQQSQRHLLEGQRLAHVGSAARDLATNRVMLSEESVRIFFGDDATVGDVGVEELFARVHPDDRDRVRREREETIATGKAEDAEFRVVRPDGSIRTIYTRSQLEYDEHGRPRILHGANLDVTERKHAELLLGRRMRQQAAVAQLGIRALAGAPLQALFDEAADLVARTLEADYSTIMERPAEGSAPILRAAAGPHRPSSLLDEGAVNGIRVPIRGAERAFGVLGVHTRTERIFDDEDLNFLWSIANLLAVTIERTTVQDELHEKRAQLEALSQRLLETQEAERRALALELHDDLGQFLTAIRLNLQANRGGEGNMRESLALVDEAIERVRSLALELRPSILDDLGLVAALRWTLNRQARSARFEGQLVVADLDEPIPPLVATCCFRLAQEALTNVARHAHAKRVQVELRREGAEAIVIIVRDDGIGFDVRAARERAVRDAPRLGLIGMEERVRLASGSLTIESSPGAGTSVRARLPTRETT